MQKIKINIQDEVKDLLKEITKNVKGYDVYLGGGYLRDSYCNLTYKDIDIFLTPNGEDKDLLLYTPKGFRISYSKNTDTTGDMRRRGVGGLIGMYKSKAELNSTEIQYFSTELQYIIYDKPMTQEELVLDMDMNINQVMLKSSDEECIASDEFIEGHKYEYIKLYILSKLCSNNYDGLFDNVNQWLLRFTF